MTTSYLVAFAAVFAYGVWFLRLVRREQERLRRRRILLGMRKLVVATNCASISFAAMSPAIRKMVEATRDMEEELARARAIIRMEGR